MVRSGGFPICASDKFGRCQRVGLSHYLRTTSALCFLGAHGAACFLCIYFPVKSFTFPCEFSSFPFLAYFVGFPLPVGGFSILVPGVFPCPCAASRAIIAEGSD